MKPNHHRKLVLNRETIRELNNPQLMGIQGGQGGPTKVSKGRTCFSCSGCATTRDPQEPI